MGLRLKLSCLSCTSFLPLLRFLRPKAAAATAHNSAADPSSSPALLALSPDIPLSPSTADAIVVVTSPLSVLAGNVFRATDWRQFDADLRCRESENTDQ